MAFRTLVGVGLALDDGFVDGDVFTRPDVVAPPLLSTYAPPPTRMSSSTMPMTAGRTQRGRPHGPPPWSSLCFLGAVFRAGAGAGARVMGGVATGAGSGAYVTGAV